ncbi:TauD/TfdA family dioxygenase [Micromonospora palythoicola]|uniref:TauD/TfdA family dioxygenase n=1 Tax=Micromonospora palythoicola TaxID=3120507 RepID=UPI002FCE0426
MTHASLADQAVADRSDSASEYTLSPHEIHQVALVVERLRSRVSEVDRPETVTAAQLLHGHLPEGLLRALEHFRRYGNPDGALTIRNLPLPDDLPPTPRAVNSVAVECTPSAALLLLLMSRMGDAISYAEEKHGALIHDICPIPGEEDQQQNTGAVYFKLHTENAFHVNRPDFLGLLCLRPDHDMRAASITSSISRAVRLLDPVDDAVLRQPRFRTRLAPSFCRGQASRPYLDPAPVLAGSPAHPLLTVDFDDTAPCDPQAEAALNALHTALHAVRREAVLLTGDLVIIDNSTTVHGRSEFTPRYDGADRWLQRMFVVRSLRNALDLLEPAGGYRCRALAVP